MDVLVDRAQRYWGLGMLNGCAGIFRVIPLSAAQPRPAHAQQVVGGRGKVRLQLNAGGADEARLAKAAVGLEPAEDLVDPFALTPAKLPTAILVSYS